MRRLDVPYSKATAHLTDTASYDLSLHAIVTRAQREQPRLFQSTSPNTVGTLVHLINWFVHTFRDDPSTTENALITKIDQLRFPMADQHLLCDYQNILSLLSNKLDGLIKSSHVNDDYRTAQLYKLIDTIPVSVTNKRPLLSVEVEKYVQATIQANPNDKRGRYAIAIEYVEELGRNDETLYAQQQHQLNLQQPPADKIRSRPSRDTRYEARATTTGSSGAIDAHMDDYNAQLDYISNAAGIADHCTCCGSTDCDGRTDLRSCNFIWLYVYEQKKRVALSFDNLKDLEPSVRSLIIQSAQTKGCLQNKTAENMVFFMESLNKAINATNNNKASTINSDPHQRPNYPQDRNHDRNHGGSNNGGRGNRSGGSSGNPQINPNYHGSNYNPNYNHNNRRPSGYESGGHQPIRTTRTDNPIHRPLTTQVGFPTIITISNAVPPVIPANKPIQA